jgi:hypothetical protein
MGAEDHTGEHSFDELARVLASGTVSRRKALRLFGAALAGSMMASVPGIAWAKPCKAGEFRCGKKCCPDVASCVRGQCVCPPGTTFCSGGTARSNTCVDTSTYDCSACNHQCGERTNVPCLERADGSGFICACLALCQPCSACQPPYVCVTGACGGSPGTACALQDCS